MHRKTTFQEALAKQQTAESKAKEEEEMFKKQLHSKRAAVPITSVPRRRASDPAPTEGRNRRRPSNATPLQVSVRAADATSTDEIDVHYYHGLEANTQVRVHLWLRWMKKRAVAVKNALTIGCYLRESMKRLFAITQLP